MGERPAELRRHDFRARRQEFGNGGFVETSGKSHLDFLGDVNTRAWNGKNGTLLLDPENYTIWNGVGPTPAGSSITNTLLNSQLASNDVTIQTNNAINPPGQSGDILVNAAVNLEHRQRR